MYGPDEKLGDMRIDITAGEFHQTHGNARKVCNKLKSGKSLSHYSVVELVSMRDQLVAAMKLTMAETGPDLAFAPTYGDELELINEELGRR